MTVVDQRAQPPGATHVALREALDRSEERFHLLVDAVRDYAIFILDPQGYITSWNAGAQRIKGYTEREIVGQHFSRFYTPEDQERGLPASILRTAAEEGRFQTEGWRVRKDGTRFWADVTITAIRDDAGALLGFAKITRDLTERRQAEAERRQRLAAEEAARMRTEFLSVAAHELKTPLTSLRAVAELTLRRYQRDGEVSAERVMHALSTINTQVGKLTRLVEHLLDVSRLEAGHLALERRETDLGELTTSVVAMFRNRDDGARLHLDVPDAPLLASVDSLRVEQVLTNVVDNALKYSPPDSPVRVRVAEHHASADDVSGASGASGATIIVEDEGPGVPLEDQPHIFDRFFRSRSTSFTSGMGLGLYVTRQIVELHGGTIRAEFPPDGGMRVVVELPATPPQAQAPSDLSASAAPSASSAPSPSGRGLG
jgi:PAS domain S-box-containing protein